MQVEKSNDLRQIVEDTLNKVKNAAGAGFNSVHFNYGANEYVIGYDSAENCVLLWADGGGTVLDNELPVDNPVDAIIKYIENFEKGLINCSGCGKLMNRNTINGKRYFAGTYCQDCWDKKYADLARTTYYD